MNQEHFSNNLRRLRLEKRLTQEQISNLLGVSVQTVSRWECNNTFPDILLLPEIAKLYGVTIDDLFRPEAKGYQNYAQRLLAVYEQSGRTEDYLAAEQEFLKIPTTELTSDDLRSWGVLYHYMMKHCAEMAQQKLSQAIHHPEVSEDTYLSAAQQNIALQCDLGKGHAEGERYEEALKKAPKDYRLWLLCIAAYEFTGEYERALAIATQAINHFPKQASIYVHMGDICRNLKRYDEAFDHWQKALALDNTFLDAMYSIGFCYEELAQYQKAYDIWMELARILEQRGLVIECEYPAKLAEACQKKVFTNQ